MAKILITGGGGFQGRSLVEYFLKKGHKITVLNTLSDKTSRALKEFKNKITIVYGSVTDKEIVYKTVRDHDCVFHFAARIHVDESITDPLSSLNVNIYGTYNVLESVTYFKSRLIFLSSCEVYGAPLNNFPIKEDAELRPHSPYAASKAAADRLCFAYFTTYGTDVVIIRPFNVFGPNQKNGIDGAAIPIFVDLAMKGKPLAVYGDGSQTRDYMYIDDLVRAYDLIYNHPELKGDVINIGTGKETKIIDIAEYIAKKFHVKIVHKKARAGEVSHFRADVTKAKKMGFKPTVDVMSGIDNYLEWHKHNNKKGLE